MAALKTQPNSENVNQYISAIGKEQQRMDCVQLLRMMESITGSTPTMWGNSIVGFGSYHYRYDSGREGDWFLTGFSARKQNISIYIMAGFSEFEDLMANLGKHKTGKSCLYVKRLSDIDQGVLEKLIRKSVTFLRKNYPTK